MSITDIPNPLYNRFGPIASKQLADLFNEGNAKPSGTEQRTSPDSTASVPAGINTKQIGISCSSESRERQFMDNNDKTLQQTRELPIELIKLRGQLKEARL